MHSHCHIPVLIRDEEMTPMVNSFRCIPFSAENLQQSVTVGIWMKTEGASIEAGR